jgi:putative membrane protein
MPNKGRTLMKEARHSRSNGRSLPEYLVLSAKGFCMGACDVVPGVSGGTMAFILGIYDELIDAIRSFDLKAIRLFLTLRIRGLLDRVSWQFILALGTGILVAIFTLARVLSWLLENTPVHIWSFFLGLILASAFTVSRRVEGWRLSTWLGLLGGGVGAYFLVGLVPVSTPDTPWFLFLSGAIAICAMILPGISGSFVLVLLGKYQFLLEAVNNRDFLVLAIAGAGAVTGIALFSRLLGWLLRNYHDLMVAILTGLMLGSLRKVWPWKETLESFLDSHGKVVPLLEANILPAQWNMEVFSALSLMALGFLVVFFLDRMAGR